MRLQNISVAAASKGLLWNLAFLFCFALATQSVAVAKNGSKTKTFFVDPNGDNENPGSRRKPWKTIQFACLRLAPGDTLKVAKKEFPDEGSILVRFVDPETYEYLPLEGSLRKTTRIVGYGRGRTSPRVHGKFDIRGSHLMIRGLEIVGDDTDPLPGIGVYESHHVSIVDCSIHNHGGGGINFNQSDCVTASYNRVFENAKLNPDQHSGISSYQPIVRSNDTSRYGLILTNNICYRNENEVPSSWSGEITDGNGITIDDHRYTQSNQNVIDAIKGTSNPSFSSGQPVVHLDAEGNPIPYARRTLVMRNQCFLNGGRGIHVFQSDQIDVVMNYAARNLQSPVFSDGLPRDDNDEPYFVNGQISNVDSGALGKNIFWFNYGFADTFESAGAAELFFDDQSKVLDSPNDWCMNFFFNFANWRRSVEVFGVDDSSLLRRRF